MSVIHVNLDEVRRTGESFNRMHGEVSQLVGTAKSQMGNLESQFKGARASKIFGQWQEMQPSLDAAMRTLEAAGRLLSTAASDFEAVDLR